MMYRKPFLHPTRSASFKRFRRRVVHGSVAVATMGTVLLGSRAVAQDLRSQIRPIGSPSQVDRMMAANRERVHSSKRERDDVRRSNIRLTQFAVPAGPPQSMPSSTGELGLPPGESNGVAPFSGASPSEIPPAMSNGVPSRPPAGSTPALPTQTLPIQSAPTRTIPPRTSAVTNDLTPLATPALVPDMATVGNSCHVSPPSAYSSSMASGCGGCGVVPYPATTVAPPVVGGAAIPSFGSGPAIAPGVPLGGVISGVDRAGPLPPLFTLGQQNYPVRLGQGWYGQPTAYVEGQGVRNLIRYLSP